MTDLLASLVLTSPALVPPRTVTAETRRAPTRTAAPRTAAPRTVPPRTAPPLDEVVEAYRAAGGPGLERQFAFIMATSIAVSLGVFLGVSVPRPDGAGGRRFG